MVRIAKYANPAINSAEEKRISSESVFGQSEVGLLEKTGSTSMLPGSVVKLKAITFRWTSFSFARTQTLGIFAMR